MQNYKELIVWQRAHQLTLKVYEITKSFPKDETYGITSQLRRASVSIGSNIAEGSGKYHSNDFANFLNISLGSANEVDYLLLVSKDLQYISVAEYEKTEVTTNEIKAMLISFIKKVRQYKVNEEDASYSNN